MFLDPNLCSICEEAQDQHLEFLTAAANNQNLIHINPNGNNRNKNFDNSNNDNNNFNGKILSASENSTLKNASGSPLNLSSQQQKQKCSVKEAEDMPINGLQRTTSNNPAAAAASAAAAGNEANSILLGNSFNKNTKNDNNNNINHNNNNNNNINNPNYYVNNANSKREVCLLPEEVITELQNPNLCVICFDSDTSKDPSVKFQCNHIFCIKCVKSYLEKSIQNGKVNIVLIRFLT